MKSLKQWFVLTVFSALACSGLNAQIVNMSAHIPFDFHAGDKVMPAGEYQIHGEGQWFTLRSLKDRKALTTVVTQSAGSEQANRAASLDFTRLGDTHFLTTIWNGYSADGRQLAAPAIEKELGKNAKPSRVTIAVRR